MAPRPCRWTVTGRMRAGGPCPVLCLREDPAMAAGAPRAMRRAGSAASRCHPCGRPLRESWLCPTAVHALHGAARSPYENFLLQCHPKQDARFRQAGCLFGRPSAARTRPVGGRPGAGSRLRRQAGIFHCACQGGIWCRGPSHKASRPSGKLLRARSPGPSPVRWKDSALSCAGCAIVRVPLSSIHHCFLGTWRKDGPPFAR